MFVDHFDKQYLPIANGMPEENKGRTRRLARDVIAIDKNIKVVIPKYFQMRAFE